MSELFEVGQRVRVRLDIDACPQAGILHGWATGGRTGTIMWEEPDRADGHRWVVGYFHPAVLVDGHWYSGRLHNWFMPSELEDVLPTP